MRVEFCVDVVDGFDTVVGFDVSGDVSGGGSGGDRGSGSGGGDVVGGGTAVLPNVE